MFQKQVLVFTVALSARVTHHNSESGDLWVPLQATVNSQVIELLLCCVWLKGEHEKDKHSRCGGGLDKIDRLFQSAGGGRAAKAHKEEMIDVEFAESKMTKPSRCPSA